MFSLHIDTSAHDTHTHTPERDKITRAVCRHTALQRKRAGRQAGHITLNTKRQQMRIY